MLDFVNKLIWVVATVGLVISGVYFTFITKGKQFSFKYMGKSLKEKDTFKSISLSLAAKVGVGSIAGVAFAIYYGGVGTIFWIWVATIITASNTYVESVLGVKYQKKIDLEYMGGPSYYIQKGLNKKKTACFYAFLVIFAYILGFIPIQANTIAMSLKSIYSVPTIMTGVILGLITLWVIFYGIKRIHKVSTIIVPIMGAIYLSIGFIVILTNLEKIPSTIMLIFKSAFSLETGFFGLLSGIIIGIQRGIFASESGVGCGAIAAASNVNSSPDKQGIIQIIGVYFSGLIICTISAFIIILSDYRFATFKNINGIEIVQYAFKYHFGNKGPYLLLITIMFFAFSTIITGYYFSETSAKYLKQDLKGKQLFILKLLTFILILYGAITKATILWSTVDIIIALMAIINIYAIISLRKQVR